jgi:hypothetical protein
MWNPAALSESDSVLPEPTGNAQEGDGDGSCGNHTASFNQMGVEDIAMDMDAVESSGRFALEIGAATFRLQPNGGAATRKITYVAIWKRRPTGAR